MEDKIILLIIKVFVKIVSIIEIIMKKYIKKQQASINYNLGVIKDWSVISARKFFLRIQFSK